MPGVTRWMIRCSLIYFLAGAGIGMAMLINKAVPLFPKIWLLLPIHIEFMIFGWVIQFTLGTAHWILPRFLSSKSRGNPKLAVLIVVLLNGGILLVILAGSVSSLPELALWGRILESFSVMLFTGLHWKRIVSYASV